MLSLSLTGTVVRPEGAFDWGGWWEGAFYPGGLLTGVAKNGTSDQGAGAIDRGHF